MPERREPEWSLPVPPWVELVLLVGEGIGFGALAITLLGWAAGVPFADLWGQ